jgi:hypothetical protein
MHPDEFELPGVALDVKVFQTSPFPQPAPQSQD